MRCLDRISSEKNWLKNSHVAAKLPRACWVQQQLPASGPSTATPAEDPGVEAEEKLPQG